MRVSEKFFILILCDNYSADKREEARGGIPPGLRSLGTRIFDYT